MDIKEIEELIQSELNIPLTRFPYKPPKVELHTVVDVSDMCAAEFLSKVESICRICLEKAEQPDLIEKLISTYERAHIRPVEVSPIIPEMLRFGMPLDYDLILLNSSEEEDNS